MESTVANPVHLQIIAARRDALRAALARVLPSGSAQSGPPLAGIVCEIGCGHGHFLTAYAEVHPSELCIGFDLCAERIERANRKRDRAGLANLHFFRADAYDFLAALPAGVRFSRIFILFPDPWPKKRHHKNRLLKPGFLDALAVHTGQGTRLYFRTDYESYFAETSRLLETHSAWRKREAADWPWETATVFQQRAPIYHSLVAERI